MINIINKNRFTELTKLTIDNPDYIVEISDIFFYYKKFPGCYFEIEIGKIDDDYLITEASLLSEFVGKELLKDLKKDGYIIFTKQ